MILYHRPKPKKSQAQRIDERNERILERSEQENLRRERHRMSLRTDSIAVELGCQIRDKRMSLGLTQQELASRASTRQSAVSRLECGDYLPRLSVLKRYAKILNLEVRVILSDSDKK
ncbi:MAG TPA: helix-turn-helix transcriptional regulator [Candidatus Saccharimonadales bacterium]|nr:helix-turn-helix transcriptional regulator [Candidatus Saccharimonadales bacterium]